MIVAKTQKNERKRTKPISQRQTSKFMNKIRQEQEKSKNTNLTPEEKMTPDFKHVTPVVIFSGQI